MRQWLNIVQIGWGMQEILCSMDVKVENFVLCDGVLYLFWYFRMVG